MTREDNLRTLIAALDFEIESTTPQGCGPIKVENGGEWNKLSEVRGIAKRRLNELIHLNDKREEERLKNLPPVDRSARELVSGKPVPEDYSHTEDRGDGQQKDYVVLTKEERSKGFVRPYRDAYRHLKCGKITTMGRPIAETLARDPEFYSGGMCVHCGSHFPNEEFVWYEMDGTTGPKVGT